MARYCSSSSKSTETESNTAAAYPGLAGGIATKLPAVRILVLGSGGQLGRELGRANWPDGLQAVLRSRQQQDMANEAGVTALLEQLQPAFVLNAAAYTAVDAAEHDEAAAFQTNAHGPAGLARACHSCGAALIHISTDYVFDGASATAYKEDDAPAPLSVYGRSKLEGEQAVRDTLAQHLIVRTSWLHGALGQNFVTAMLRLGREREQIRVVADQFGRPTSAAELAKALVQIGE